MTETKNKNATTLQKVRAVLDKSGLSEDFVSSVLTKLQVAKARPISLSRKVRKRIEEELNAFGLCAIKMSKTGGLHVIGAKHITLAPRYPFEDPELNKKAHMAKAKKKLARITPELPLSPVDVAAN